jgi:hypothetical protein
VDRYVSPKSNPSPAGRPWERLYFRNHPPVNRLRVGVVGFDDPPPRALPRTNVINSKN